MQFSLSIAVALFLWCASAFAQPPVPEPEADPPAPPPDAPPDTTQACVDAFGLGQTLRREGRLRASREQLLICAQPSCPQLLSDKCIPWLAEVEAALPSIVVVAKDPQGRDTAEVRVMMDGVIIAEALTGRTIDVDPGPRQFRFDNPNALAIEQQLVIVQGEKGRRVELAFEVPPTLPPLPPPLPPPMPPPRAAQTGLSPLLWVGVTIGAVGVTVGTVTGIVAIVQAGDLDEQCRDGVCPTALQGDYDTGIAFAHASTVSFIVGGIGGVLALGAWLFDDDDDARAWLGPGSAGLAGRF